MFSLCCESTDEVYALVQAVGFSRLAESCSELFLLHGVVEEEESGAFVLLLLLVGESESTIHVELGAGVELELIESANNVLDHFGGSLFELWDTFALANFFKLGRDGLEELLHPSHEVLLGHLDLVELEGVNDVDDSLTSSVVLDDIVRCDRNLFGALGSVASLDFETSVVEAESVLVRVRDHLVSTDKINPNLHDVIVCCLCLA